MKELTKPFYLGNAVHRTELVAILKSVSPDVAKMDNCSLEDFFNDEFRGICEVCYNEQDYFTVIQRK